MSIKISVIIATYNASKTLERCLDALAPQKDLDVEVIVIDGGSTDGTLEIITHYKDTVDFVLSEPDRGIYDAWNKGVANAHGDWIAFVGADDTLEPDALSNMLEFLGRNDTTRVDYICAKNTYVGKDGVPLKVFGVPWRWEQFRRTMQLAHVGSLHRRTLFVEVDGFDINFRICGDYELLLRKKAHLNTLFIDGCLARMAIGGTSYSLAAVKEADLARKLHSDLPRTTLQLIYWWQILLFLRHRLLHSRSC